MDINEYLTSARARIERVLPEHLDDEMGSGALLVDIRPEADRRASGEMDGAVVIDRNVLEWRLAPSSENRTHDVAGRKVILVCNDGYQSSLAAATLVDLGVDGATDLIGGYRAWRDRVSTPH